MKFEFVNENKIRIEITKEDLLERDLKIVELAYGSDKAREFFQEVMELAYEELGFDVNNIPIVVEAVPVSVEEINIFVTKVTDPNELEKKLAKMPEDKIKQNIDIDVLRQKLEEAKENIFNDISKRKAGKLENDSKDENAINEPVRKEKGTNINLAIFSFDSLDTVAFATKRVPSDIEFKSSLVLNNERYYLTLETKKLADEEFSKIETRLFEYGDKHISTIESRQHLFEHGEVIIKKDALKVLSEIE